MIKIIKEQTTDKEMMLLAIDVIRTISEHQTGIRQFVGKILNKITYMYYKAI